MPIIDFTNPFYLGSALILFILCIYLARSSKSNTIPCIMLLSFLAILVGHTIELSLAQDVADTITLTICIIVDEAFTFAAFLSFLWTDKLQVDKLVKTKGSSKAKKEIIIKDDGLDILWRQV